MNKEAEALLAEILAKNPEALSENEIDFLRARRSYLKKIHLEEFKDVLENQTSKEETVKSHDKETAKK